LQVWLYPFLFLLGASALIFLASHWLDARRLPKAPPLLWNLTHFEGGPISDLLRDVSQLVTALLGVAISVVAIIVELAANRYTHKITELFFRSKVNFTVMGFFVIAAIDSIWVSFTFRDNFVPVWGTLVSMVLMTLSMLLLLPYFAFVFDFLNPLNIVARIRSETLSVIRSAPAIIGTAKRSAESIQENAADGTEQLSDVVLNAMANHDGAIAIASVTALGDLGQDYLDVKGALPLDWFVITDAVAENPDFVSMSPEVLESVGRERDWFEFKLLRQFQTIYQGGLGGSRELCYVVAIKTRELAESAMDRSEPRVVSLCIKFFNTYLRSTVNGRDVRTAYNVFHQYRLLAEAALQRNQGRFAVEIARYFKYYGQLAFNADLGFILETSAYDLCTLNEIAFNRQSSRAPGAAAHLPPGRQGGRRRHPRGLPQGRAQGAGEARHLVPPAPRRGLRARGLPRHALREPGAAREHPGRDPLGHLAGVLGGHRPGDQLRLHPRGPKAAARGVLRVVRRHHPPAPRRAGARRRPRRAPRPREYPKPLGELIPS
jgi:hypothetical protein